MIKLWMSWTALYGRQCSLIAANFFHSRSLYVQSTHTAEIRSCPKEGGVLKKFSGEEVKYRGENDSWFWDVYSSTNSHSLMELIKITSYFESQPCVESAAGIKSYDQMIVWSRLEGCTVKYIECGPLVKWSVVYQRSCSVFGIPF